MKQGEEMARFQTLDQVSTEFNRRKRYSKVSLMALFVHCRRKPNLSLFGDYPLIAEIVTQARARNKDVSDNMILYAVRCSKELKGQRELINQLKSM